MLAIGLDQAGAPRRSSARPKRLRAARGRRRERPGEHRGLRGSAADVALAVALLERRGISHRLLRGNVAFHSRAMGSIEADLRDALAFLDTLPMTASAPFISSVTGEVTENLDAAYWWSNVRCPVRFAAATEAALRDFRPDVIIEVTPATALLPSVRQCLDDRPPGSLAAPAGPACHADPRRRLQGVVPPGAGRPVPGGNTAGLRRPVPAGQPSQPPAARAPQGRAADDEPVRRRHLLPQAGRLLGGPAARAADPRRPAALRGADERRGLPVADHRVQNTPIMPAAGYVEMILQALGGAPAHFSQVEFRKPCLLTGAPVRLQTELEPAAGQPGAFSFRIISSSYEEGIPAVLHCTGKVP